MYALKTRKFAGQVAPEWATAIARYQEGWRWEESLEQKLGDRFCWHGFGFFECYIRTYTQETRTRYSEACLLPPLEVEDDPLEVEDDPLEVEDDPLPPAPESARYVGLNSMVRSQLDLWPHADTLRIKVGNGQLDGSSKMVILDPDAALQLAHDLRRMAMDIKRKQKEVD